MSSLSYQGDPLDKCEAEDDEDGKHHSEPAERKDMQQSKYEQQDIDAGYSPKAEPYPPEVLQRRRSLAPAAYLFFVGIRAAVDGTGRPELFTESCAPAHVADAFLTGFDSGFLCQVVLHPCGKGLFSDMRTGASEGLEERFASEEVEVVRVRMSGIDELAPFIESRIVAFQPFQLILIQLELGF